MTDTTIATAKMIIKSGMLSVRVRPRDGKCIGVENLLGALTLFSVPLVCNVSFFIREGYFITQLQSLQSVNDGHDHATP
jgi:hypothetical protein